MTIDDDLYVTRRTDLQVKSLVFQKEDASGHVSYSIADVIFQITLDVLFRRRGEHEKTDAVTMRS